MKPSLSDLLQELKKLNDQEIDLSAKNVAEKDPKLFKAVSSEKTFGSWNNALAAAGLRYPGAGADPVAIKTLLDQAVVLDKQYRAVTGKPLGITGEVAEFWAAHMLGLILAEARTAGFDALWVRGNDVKRIQIKSRAYPKDSKKTQKIGAIKTEMTWDSVLLVILDEDLEVQGIYEAERTKIEKELKKTGSKARKRGVLTAGFFKNHGTPVWPIRGGQ